MSEVLKGNYHVPAERQPHVPDGLVEDSLLGRFEAATLAKVGGSICFVMTGDGFVWDGDDSSDPPGGGAGPSDPST